MNSTIAYDPTAAQLANLESLGIKTVQDLIRYALKRGMNPSALLEQDLGAPSVDSIPESADHPVWCTDPECEGPGDHSASIKSGLFGSEGQSIDADINMRDGKPVVAIFGLDDDFGRPVEHMKAVAQFLTAVCNKVEAG
ncbi:hypothetical protein [Arthrobacter sp. HLT1-21]